MSKNTLIYNNTPPYTVVASGTGTNLTATTITLTGMTTSNIQLIAVAVSRASGGLTITDTQSNGYLFLTAAGTITVQIGYVLRPVMASSMTWTITGAANAAAVFVVQGPNPPIPAFDKQNNNGAAGASATASTGQITPTFNGDWLLAAASTGTGTVLGTASTIPGWTLTYIPFVSGNHQGLVCYNMTQQYSAQVGVTFSHSAGTITYFGASIGSWLN